MKKTFSLILTMTLALVGSVAFGQRDNTNPTNSDDTEPNRVVVNGNIYGGGALANVEGNSSVLIDKEKVLIWGNVFGGGLGRLSQEGTEAQGTEGTEGYVPAQPAVTPVAALVEGDVTVTVNHGIIKGDVFGCNDLNGTPLGTVTVTVNGSDGSTVSGDDKTYAIHGVYGGGNLAHYEPTTITRGYPSVTINGCNTSVGDVFGGGKAAPVSQTNVVINGGDINRAFAGGDGDNDNDTPAHIGYNTTSTEADPNFQSYLYGSIGANGVGDANIQVNGGTVNQVFGGSNKNGVIADSVNIEIEKSAVEGACEMHIAEVYGGGNEATSKPATTYRIGCTGGETEGIGKVFGGANAANVSGGDIILTLSQGRITEGIYGGNNSKGSVHGNIEINLRGAATCNVPFPTVFGGGYGEGTETTGNVTVNIGTIDGDYQPKVNGDVYGGSALGNVNDAPADCTTINILNGTIYGNVYGGGLGDADHEAAVYGKVRVNVGKYEGGSYYGNASFGSTSAIYGCNNTNGSPQDDVEVHIYRTAHIDANSYPNDYNYPPSGINSLEDLATLVANPDAASYPTKFAISAVYGGGNKASYIPASSGKTALVHVYQCDDNTIQTVYGGGNAADVGNSSITTNTHIIFDGGFVDRVFGGGNGYSATGNHDDPSEPNYNPGANIFGTATTEINGGLYRQVFGGNNQYGNVYQGIDLSIVKEPGCNLLVHESFGGANEAEISSDVTTNLKCSDAQIGNFYGGSNLADITGNVTLNVYGGTYTNVFGGSKGRAAQDAVGVEGDDNYQPAISPKPANINGNVTLNLFGGHIVNAFGGSDVNGNITGKITVNMLDFETDNCGLVVNNIYGGGQDAAYTPTTPGAYPEVNVIHGSVTKEDNLYGNVFGGGKGAGAVVTSNPKVTIGYDDSMGMPDTENTLLYTLTHYPSAYSLSTSIYNTETSAFHPENLHAQVGNNVYGGGDLAVVTGSTTVLLQKDNTTVARLFGGGNEASISSSTTVSQTSGTVTAGIYGGCNTSGTVTGNATVNLLGGTVGRAAVGTPGGDDYVAAEPANVYGGGLGAATRMSGDVVVNIGATDGEETPTYSGTAIIHGDVYGGSAKGMTNCNAAGDAQNGSAKTDVTLYSGTVNGSLYGGGHGHDNASAHVWGPVQVTVLNGTVTDVFGCNNENGAPQSTVKVDIYNNVGGDVYGGGNHAAYNGTPDVNIIAGTVSGNVFGGGNDIATANAGILDSDVVMTGGVVLGGIYGGCNLNGTVTQNSSVKIYGGTLGSQDQLEAGTVANVFGGGLGADTKVNGNVTVIISRASGDDAPDAPTIYGDVYGGSALGEVNTNGNNTTTVNILDGTLVADKTSEVLGNGQTVYFYTGGNVFGGGLGRKADQANNITAIPAKVYGVVTVNIGSGTTGTTSEYDGSAFTGNATIGGNVYGGNNTNGSPQDNVTVNVYRTAHTENDGVEGTEYAIANVFGGGNEANYAPENGLANTQKVATVNIFGCNNTVERVFGGGNAAATPGVHTDVQGGRFSQIFGGGNGERGPQYGADINGNLYLAIHGGNVGQFYGISNQNGNVSGSAQVVTDNNGPCGEMLIDEFFCGGNFADITGDLTTTITCSEGMVVRSLYGGCNQAVIRGNVTLNVEGGTFTNVYGGSRGVAGVDGISADILDNPNTANVTEGNVTLNLYGGTIENVYGGSNVKGNIEGRIIVNIIDIEGACPLYITNIYGGSNLADYSPDSVSHVVVTDPNRISPVINIVHAKNGISGNVYGGSRGMDGSDAVTTLNANPLVNVGYNADMNSYLPSTYVSTYSSLLASPRAIIAGSVFGGGDAAKVVGDTKIMLRNRAKVFGNVYGGGNMGEVTGDTKVIVNGDNQ